MLYKHWYVTFGPNSLLRFFSAAFKTVWLPSYDLKPIRNKSACEQIHTCDDSGFMRLPHFYSQLFCIFWNLTRTCVLPQQGLPMICTATRSFLLADFIPRGFHKQEHLKWHKCWLRFIAEFENFSRMSSKTDVFTFQTSQVPVSHIAVDHNQWIERRRISSMSTTVTQPATHSACEL